jgi:hypothetical protein
MSPRSTQFVAIATEYFFFRGTPAPRRRSDIGTGVEEGAAGSTGRGRVASAHQLSMEAIFEFH